jgi:diguanylate cyclase (GGDEF)-like protein
VREVDTVARFGGDEFVVELDGVNADREEAILQSHIIAEKIRSCLSEPYLLSVSNEDTDETVVEHHSSASIGVTVFGKDATSQDDVMKQADAEMYNAKNSGRNVISIYEKGAN